MKYLIISNATFSPRQMKQISQRLIAENIKIYWCCFARFDERFNSQIFSLAKKAGCQTMGFGLESINQRVLDVIRKGTKVETIKRLIKESYSTGFRIYVQVIIGLPTETKEEALDTICFLLEHKSFLKEGVTFNIYYLTPKNYVYECPTKYNIEYSKDSKVPFKFLYNFKHTDTKFSQKEKQMLILTYDKLLNRSR